MTRRQTTKTKKTKKTKNRYGFEKKGNSSKLDRWIAREIKSAAKSADKATRKRKRKKNPAVDFLDSDVLPFHVGLPVWPDRRRVWSASAAEKRVRRWAGAEDEPNALYQIAFLWHDSERPEEFGSYKLPFCDVIHGKLYAIQRGLSAAKGRAGEVLGPDRRKLPRADLRQIYHSIGLYQARALRQEQAPRRQPPKYWRRRNNPELFGDALELTVAGVAGRAHREALSGMGSDAREQYYETFENQDAVFRSRALAEYGAKDEVIAAAPAETPAMQKRVLEEEADTGEWVTVEMSSPLLAMFQHVARELDEQGHKSPHTRVFVEGEEAAVVGKETFQVRTSVVGWEHIAEGVREKLEDVDGSIRDKFTREILRVQEQLDGRGADDDVADDDDAAALQAVREFGASYDEGYESHSTPEPTEPEPTEPEPLETLDDIELSGEESYIYSDGPSDEDLEGIDNEDIEVVSDEEYAELADGHIPGSPAVVEVKDADLDIEEEAVEDGRAPATPEETLGGESLPVPKKVLVMLANIFKDSAHGAEDQTWRLASDEWEEDWNERGEVAIRRSFYGKDQNYEFVVTLLCLNVAAPNWVAAAQEAGELGLGPVYAVFLDAWDAYSEVFYRYSDILTKDAKQIKDPEHEGCSFPVYLSLKSLLSTTLRDYLSSQEGLTYMKFRGQIPTDKCAPTFPRERTSNPGAGALLPMAYALTSAVGLGASLYDLHNSWKSR